MRLWVLWLVAVLCSVLGCGGPPQSGVGGSGGSGGEGAGGSAAHGGPCGPLCEGGGGATSTTTTTPTKACDADPGCAYGDPLLSFDEGAEVVGVFGPIPPWRTGGAVEGCGSPLGSPYDVTQAVVGFGGPPPDTLPVAVRFVDSYDLAPYLPSFVDLALSSTEAGPGSTTLGVYDLPATVQANAGQIPCVAVPLSADYPVAVTQPTCEDPRRSRWLGLPVSPSWTGDADPTMEELTWALLACPIDTTTDDGTPAVAIYKGDFLRGVR